MRTRPLLLTFMLSCGAADAPGGAQAHRLDGQIAVEDAAAVPLECDVAQHAVPLPAAVRESSGLARGIADPALLWTHNDAGHEPYVHALTTDGRVVGSVRIDGAKFVDWEDIEAAACDGGGCLYIADTGDNDEDRSAITVYRVSEPAPGDAAASAVALHARFPDGPRDVEALFAGADGLLYIVTKGRSRDVTLHRWPAAAAGDTVTLETLRTLFPRPAAEADRVTAASASPDGRWVAIRTYRTLYVYPFTGLTAGDAVQPHSHDLTALGEPQGEGVAILDDGTIWLSSEAGGRGRPPLLSRLQCSLPR